MKVELYTSKTLKECVSALNERLNDDKQKPSAKALLGSVDKAGNFSLSHSSQVLGFRRSTQMLGTLERESGMTVLRGRVHEGMPPKQVRVIIYAVLLIALLMFLNGNGLLAFAFSGAALLAYVWMIGDHHNSALLLKELKRVLNAKDKPVNDLPNKSASASKAAPKPAVKPSSSSAKPSASASAKPSQKAASASQPVAKSASPAKPKTPVR